MHGAAITKEQKWLELQNNRPKCPQQQAAKPKMAKAARTLKRQNRIVSRGSGVARPRSIRFLLTSLLILFHSFSIHFLLIFYSFSTPFYSFPTPLWGDEKSWKIIGNRVFSNSLIAGHYKGMLKIIGNRVFCKFPISRTVFKNCKKMQNLRVFKPAKSRTLKIPIPQIVYRLTSLHPDTSCEFTKNMKNCIKKHEKL